MTMLKILLMIKKTITFSAAIILILFCGLFFVTHYVSYDTATSHFAKELHLSPTNIAKIKVVKFPIPYLSINYIKEDGHMELKNVEVHFSALSLLALKPKISIVRVRSAKIYSDEESFNITKHDQVIAKFIREGMLDIDFNVKNLMILNQNNQPIITFKNCLLHKNNILADTSYFQGELADIGKLSGDFVRKSNQTEFNFTINNADYDFHLTEIYTDSKLSSGKGKYVIKNIASLLHQLIPDLDLLARRFKKTETVNVGFDIALTSQLIKLENLTIDSNFCTGNGAINLSKNTGTTSTITLHIDKIDMRPLWSTTNEINKLNDSAHGIRFMFGNKSVITSILIDQIILNNNEIINQTKLALKLDQGIFLVEDFSGIINSGGSFKFIGKIMQNSVRSVFDGRMHLEHSDLNSVLKTLGSSDATSGVATPFTLSSDLKLTLIDIYLQNLLLQTADTTVSGSITTRFIGPMPQIMASLEFSSVDLSKNNYPILSPIVDFTKSLFQDMKNHSYLNKYIPLRTVSFLGTIDMHFNDLVIGEAYLGKVYMLANISPGNIEINNLDIRKGDDYFNISANLLASSIKPKFTIKINDGVLNTDVMTPKTMLDLRSKLLNDFDLNKIDLDINCNLSKMSLNTSLVLQNFQISLGNEGNLFTLHEIKGDFLSGKLKGAGNIVLKPFSINLVYALNSIDLAKLSVALPKGWLDTYGGFSIHGSLSTTGDSPEKLLYELNSNSEFLIKNAKLNNFSVDELVGKINTVTYNKDSLQKDLDQAIMQGKTELLNMQGKLQLKNVIINIKEALYNTQYTTGSAAAAINIYNFEMALTSILTFYVKDFNSSKNDTITIKVNSMGSIFAPKKTIDATELQKILDKKVLKMPNVNSK